MTGLTAAGLTAAGVTAGVFAGAAGAAGAGVAVFAVGAAAGLAAVAAGTADPGAAALVPGAAEAGGLPVAVAAGFAGAVPVAVEGVPGAGAGLALVAAGCCTGAGCCAAGGRLTGLGFGFGGGPKISSNEICALAGVTNTIMASATHTFANFIGRSKTSPRGPNVPAYEAPSRRNRGG